MDLFGDQTRLLINPDQVALDETLAWRTAFWFWTKKVGVLPNVKQGFFGAGTNAINGALECNGGPNQNVARVRFLVYVNVLRAFNVNEQAIEFGCYN
jgi:chitinase